MKITVKELREEVRKAGGGKIAASDSYMKKEAIRQKLQDLVAEMIQAGEVADQASLEDAFQTLDMAMKSLKMVPFDTWTQMFTGQARRTSRKK